jgi:predicted DNA-binding protein YlxM (UPF0122 family)
MARMSAFCEMYGNTIRNRILEYLLESQGLDFSVGDMAKEIGVSRPKAYEIIGDFEKNGRVMKSRVVGKTQLYILNMSDARVKMFMRTFKDCLKLVVEEYSERSSKKQSIRKPAKVNTVASSYLDTQNHKVVEKV